MTSPVRRLVLAVGFALAWYVFVWAVLASASYLFGDAYDLLWLWKTLLFPLGLLSWLEVNLTQSFGVARGGHEVLTGAPPGTWGECAFHSFFCLRAVGWFGACLAGQPKTRGGG